MLKTNEATVENDRGELGMLSWLWVAGVVIAIDQLTKWMAESTLVDVGTSIPVFPHLNWTLAYNYGAAFSFLGDQDALLQLQLLDQTIDVLFGRNAVIVAMDDQAG